MTNLLNIGNHQGNAHANCRKIGFSQRQKASTGEDVEKGQCLHTAGGNGSSCSHVENGTEVPQTGIRSTT